MSMPTGSHADSDILKLPTVKAVQSGLVPSCMVLIEPDELMRMGRAGHTLVVSAPCNLADVTVSAGLSAAAIRRTP